jgi:hypothetical protein
MILDFALNGKERLLLNRQRLIARAYWNIGILEGWNVGLKNRFVSGLKLKFRTDPITTHYSITPSFHYSKTMRATSSDQQSRLITKNIKNTG